MCDTCFYCLLLEWSRGECVNAFSWQSSVIICQRWVLVVVIFLDYFLDEAKKKEKSLIVLFNTLLLFTRWCLCLFIMLWKYESRVLFVSFGNNFSSSIIQTGIKSFFSLIAKIKVNRYLYTCFVCFFLCLYSNDPSRWISLKIS